MGTDKLTRRRGLALLDRDIMALYVDSSAHSERVLRSKDARYPHLPVAEFVNLSVPVGGLHHLYMRMAA
jgi:hypothetical protein